ncbi:MAG: calcium-binding protein [Nitrospira sp.]|nr:calcium-binding protein [Nitrospira sp.]
MSFTLGANVEDLTLTGTADLNGTGNELDNLITGNSGINRLDGKGGTDHLIGGIGNDILAGGIGDNDLLEGGAGIDTYYYNTGDGIDQIEDSDAKGRIFYDGQLLLGGVRQDGDPADTYKSMDGAFTYVMSGGHLIVNSVLTINADFQSGQFGVKLVDGPDIPSYQNGWEVREFQLSEQHLRTDTMNVILRGTSSRDEMVLYQGNDEVYGYGGNDFLTAGLGHDRVYGGDGNDSIIGSFYFASQWPANLTEGADQLDGDDALYGEAGNDFIIGQAGNDRLFGGEGNDNLNGDNHLFYPFYFSPPGGDDLLDGGAGDDILRGDYGGDVLIGGDGDDTIYGDYLLHYKHNSIDGTLSFVAFEVARAGEDYLDGGEGADILYGDGGNDTLLGGAGNDILYGDYGGTVQAGEETLFEEVGDDYLDGGSGDDLLYGLRGHDVLSGGDGIDALYGGDGADEIYGGVGDDLLSGDYFDNSAPGDDLLFGDAGNDLLLGAAGNDSLDGGEDDDELQGGEGDDFLFGGSGDDRLFGQEGDDSVSGEEGIDQLSGGAGDDAVFGDEGNDVLLGDEGIDTIFGGRGDDGLRGGLGDDILDGGEGNDFYVFHLGDGHDVISDGAGSQEVNELVFGPGIALADLTFVHDPVRQSLMIQINGGADSIELLGVNLNNVAGTTPVELLSFADGSQIALADQLPLPSGFLGGDDGSERILAGAGDDVISAEGGNDTVFAGAGNDILIGGLGADTLFGGVGRDTYVFNPGDGLDLISDSHEEGNRLVFGAGISPDGLRLELEANSTLVIRVGHSDGGVRLFGFNPTDVAGSHSIDSFEFADGTILSYAQLAQKGFDFIGTPDSDVLLGTDLSDTMRGNAGADILIGLSGNDFLDGGIGNDVLNGGAGNDVLVGGAGDDQLYGGTGHDTYQFNSGDGIDSISDVIAVGESNQVTFGAGITPDSLKMTTVFGQVLVRPGAAFEGVQIGANGSDVLGAHAVDRFEFADGTVLAYADLVARGFDIDGTVFDDVLIGTNVVDRFRGGLGDDRLGGGAGNDSYFFNTGDGVDTIADTASAGAGNEVVFGAGITSADLRLDLAPDQSGTGAGGLLLRVGSGGDAIQLATFDRANVLGPRTVDSFRFADGSTLTYDQLLARGFDLTGTEGDDQIVGTNVVDRIVAGDGADVLRSGLGDDTLDGGLGNDRLFGGQGSDTYVFGPGSGEDTIIESQGSLDTIRMAPGVAPSDVVVTRNDRDLVLSLNGGADRLTVALYFLAAPLQIERVQFADGTVWGQALIENLAQPTITGTGGTDSLTGTSGHDRLAGLAGDDQLVGLAGNDRLDGGIGADQLSGGAGDDTYIMNDAGDVVTELVNEGNDTVLSAVGIQLSAHVENLTLTGNATINGAGNELDNVLTGNSAANVLSGGAGHDAYVVGAGDTVVELAGEGIDTIESGSTYELGANVENLVLVGSQIINGVGNDLDNVLSGNEAPNVLSGGLGNDTYLVGTGDIVVERSGEGTDTIEVTGSYRLGANLEKLVLRDEGLSVSVEGLVLTGNELDNVLTGNRYANILDGGTGADVLIGGNGDDVYVVDNTGDTAVEELSSGIDTVRSLVDYTLGANVEVLDLSAGVAQSGTGNDLDNSLYGNAQANILDGGAGNDYLAGGLGQDTYLFGHGSGRDTVQDTVLGEVNTILMAPDITPGDVVVTTGYPFSLTALVIRIVSTGDEITVPDFFNSPAHQQTQAIRFADGTVWDGNALALQASAYPRTIQSGNALDNTLLGGIGDDEIFGNLGNDQLIGGAGNDQLQGGSGGDVLRGGLGDDHLYGESFFFNGIPLEANDTLLGDAGNDTLSGDYGNDILDGGTGDDILAGGDGNDQLNGGAGSDSLAGGAGGDVYVFGRGSGRDFAYGDGEDVIRLMSDVAPSDVTITRSGAAIYLRINGTQDEIGTYLDPNDPTLRIGQVEFSDGMIWSQATLFQKALSIVGTNGPDFLDGTSLQETLSGGQGDDTYYRFAPQDTIIEASSEGLDTVIGLDGVTLPANVENLTLYEDGTLVGGAERGTGNALNNILIGNHADNVLDGGAGNDTLIGGSIFIDELGGALGDGSDILIGGEGDDFLQAFGGVVNPDGNEIPLSAFGEDLLIGGQGNDTYVVSHSNETILESVGEGIDTVVAGFEYTLGQNLENLRLTGGRAGTGNELGNLLIGNSADNVLAGEAGDDTLWGGNGLNPDNLSETISGNDTLIGGSGDDTYLFNLGDGIDTIQDTVMVGEGNRVQFGVGISRTDLAFTEDMVARTLTIHVGSGGADQLILTNFDSAGVNGSLVVETLAFADGRTANLASLLGPSITITGTEDADVLVGTIGNDGIDALGGNDTVIAGAGNDTITGGTGNDTLIGGAGDDTYVFNAGDGIDTITDASVPGEGNTVQFGQGIDPAGLSLDLGSLLIRVGATGDAIHLTNFDPTNVLGPRTIESFRFADGTVLSYDQLIARGFDPAGTAGHDTIAGTNVVDRISGLAGDDSIEAGAGQDVLRGGSGNDTYRFNLGDGLDTIEDIVAVGEGNRILFGAGIAQSDLTFTHDEAARTLTIQVGASGTDQLLLTNFDPTGANGSHVVETLAFADGNMVNLTDLFVNHAPRLTNPLADQTVPEDAPFTVVVPSTTFADEDAGDVLTYSAGLADGSTLPAWLSFDATTRSFSGTPDDAQVGALDLRVTATDTGNLTVSDVFTLTVTNVNEAPTVAAPLADQTAVEDTLFSLVVPAGTFADVDAGDVLAYSATLDNGAVLPTWLSFDPATRTFSGTPLNADVGTLTIAVTATDLGSLSATETFVLAIQNVNDAPTVAVPLADQQAATGALFIVVVPTGTFADLDAGDTLTYSATLANGAALPTWLSFNPATRMFSGTPQGSDIGALDVRIIATDQGNLSVADVFALTVTVQDLVLTGTAGNDVLTGGAGHDQLFGLAGNDTLQGGAGHDLLDGGTGADSMTGGAGNDTYVVEHFFDVVTEAANEGTDQVQSALLAYQLGANVENLTLTGTGPSAGIGNGLSNVLTGNSGANLLDGKGGADTMAGGAGDDLYMVDHTGDTVIEQANEGALDSVTSSVTYSLSTHVENLVLTGSAAINGTGNALDNVLTGNSAANVLAGLDGHDTYVIGAGDTVIEAANGGTDTVVSGITHTLATNVENLTLIGFSAVNGTGNSLNNTMTGNRANNMLSGAGGNDTLRGGLGNDQVNGGAGNDTVLFGRGDGQDLVQDNSGTADKILYDAGINPLDLVLSRQANDLRLTIHGSTDRVTIQNWYSAPATAQVETIQAGNGQTMLNSQVDQLIQAMATFTTQTGLTWDQAIDQRPQDVQTVLAASWQ